MIKCIIQRWLFLFIIAGWLGTTNQALALPFGVFDTRTMAMGGVGVATGDRSAVFNNPALLTTADEIHEWFLLLPTAGQNIYDPDKVKKGIDNFKKAADALDASPSPTNESAVSNSLTTLAGTQYRSANNIAVMLAIPSRILSGAFFLSEYDTSTAKPIIESADTISPISSPYNSVLAHRGIRIVENGASAAKIIRSNSAWLDGISVGLTAKFYLIETYDYSEPLRSADTEIKNAVSANSSQFGIDAGILKEVGVWKFALTGKNLLPGNHKYSTGGEKFKIEPQVRAGFAYKSRYTVVEMDMDLTKNQPTGFYSMTQNVALGWEWYASRYFALRAGVNTNLVGTKDTIASAGLGLMLGGFQIDLAGYTGKEGDGISGQLGFQF
jgi:hypothetical protein